MSGRPSAVPVQRARIELGPGAVHFPGWLDVEAQRHLVTVCHQLMNSDTPGYVPVLRSGLKMHLQMTCLGRHWNAQTSGYEPTRSDFDGRRAPPLSPELGAAAEVAAAAAGMPCVPDVCILNYYGYDGKLGLHQDKDESAASIAAGLPVVSISLGDTAQFLFGGLRRGDPIQTVLLRSGDVFVFGGPARLTYHGVAGIIPRTAPASLGLVGRFNLTFRRY